MQNLNYDPQGFIIGLGRVERQTSLLHQDTQTIIRILSSQATINQTQLTDINQRLQRLNQTTKASNNPRNRQTRMVGEQTQSHTRLDTAREIGSTTNTSVRQANQNRQNTPTERLRDRNGRFTSQAEEVSFIQKLSDTVAKNVADVGVDDRNLDPLVESMHEVYDTVKPMGKMLGLMWRMGAWTKNKIFAQKRNEPLSQAQEQHNRTVEEHLENIANNGRRGGLLGLLAKMLMGGLGLLMAGGKGALKLLKKGGKGLGVLGALFGVGNLVHDWDNKSHEKKSSGIGAVGGGVAGAMAGASIGSVILPGVGTVVGGLLGGKGGEALGKTASPYLEHWTNGLENYQLADKMQQAFTLGLNPFFSGASAISDWVKNKARGLFSLELPTPTSGQEPNQLPTNSTGNPSLSGATGFSGDNSTFSNGNIHVTETDIVRLSKVMQSEVGKSGFSEKWRADMGVAVLDSVLNRTVANGFPNTIKGVINQKNQFSGINGPKTYKDKFGKVHQTGSPGDVDKYQAPSSEALAFTRQYLANRASGGKRLVDTTDFLNPHVSGDNAMKQWGNKAVAEAKAKGTVYGKGNYVHYHAGRTVGNYGISLSGLTNNNPSTQSNKLQQLASQSGRFGSHHVVVGDSIGVQYNQIHGSDKSTAVNGQSPTQVLGQIQSLIKAGAINKNTEVVLSSGLSNAMNAKNSLDLVKQQLQTLQQTGANVRLLGVADNFKDLSLGKTVNSTLQHYAQAYGATFEGGFHYNPNDKYKAHPANSYFDGKNWQSNAKTLSQAYAPNTTNVNIPKLPTITQKLSTEKSDIVTASSQSQIPQNVSDKSLAYAITGGLGGERFLG